MKVIDDMHLLKTLYKRYEASTLFLIHHSISFSARYLNFPSVLKPPATVTQKKSTRAASRINGLPLMSNGLANYKTVLVGQIKSFMGLIHYSMTKYTEVVEIDDANKEGYEKGKDLADWWEVVE